MFSQSFTNQGMSFWRHLPLDEAQKGGGCVTVPPIKKRKICIKTRGGHAIWLIWGAWDKNAFSAAVRWTERQTDTHSYCKYKFILLYSFWVLSTAVMCIPMPYLLPTFVYKKNIYYHNNEDDDESNDEDYSNYCISIVYVADLYWLFTTVEQKSWSETYLVCV